MAQCKDYSSLHYRLPFEKVFKKKSIPIFHVKKPLYYSSLKYFVFFRVTSWIGMPKKQFGTVSFQTRFLGWDFQNLLFFFLPYYLHSIHTQYIFWSIRWIQLRLVYWSPNLTSTYRIYKKSMISWSSKSTNLVLIIDVLVSDHQTSSSKEKEKAFFFYITGVGSSFLKLIPFFYIYIYIQPHLWYHMVIYSSNQTFRLRNVQSWLIPVLASPMSFQWSTVKSSGTLLRGNTISFLLRTKRASLLLRINLSRPNFFKRLDVGGKLLTNQLKELVSFRQWNMMDETYIMNQVKESCCFVSSNYKQDIETCR